MDLFNSSIDLLKTGCAVKTTGVAESSLVSLLPVLVSAYCSLADVKWPKDYGPNFLGRAAEHPAYDFIVVGAGTAGSVIAGRLAESPNYRILLIEAGDDPPIESEIPNLSSTLAPTKYMWPYIYKPNFKSCLGFPGKACGSVSGKLLGGSAAINLMMYLRGNRRDFDEWAEKGNPTWDWDSVLPFFRKFENFIGPINPFNSYGVGGPVAMGRKTDFSDIRNIVFEAAREKGHPTLKDFRDGHNVGYSNVNTLIVDGKRYTSAKGYLIGSKPNLHVIKNAMVTKINFTKRKRAKSVNFAYRDERGLNRILEARATKEIIVCAGAIQSPKLLMLSGIGPKEHLQSMNIPLIKDLAVGRNLQDHSVTNVYFSYEGNKEDPTTNFYDYLAHRTGRFASVNMANLVAFLDVKNQSGVYPSVQIHNNWFAQGTSPVLPGTNNQITLAVTKAVQSKGILQMLVYVVRPHSIGYVELASTDYRVSPIVYPNYLADYRDVSLHMETLRQLSKYEYTAAFRKANIKYLNITIPDCRGLKYDSDDYWECFVRYSSFHLFHPVGTVKMGPDSDSGAVVDYKLRVRGVTGLRVADASIMPRIVSANTMATAMMIGEKAADFIKKDWK